MATATLIWAILVLATSLTRSNESYAPGDYVPEAETDAAWSNSKTELNDDACRDNVYYHVHEFTNLADYLVDYKKVASDFRECRLKAMGTKTDYFHESTKILHGQI